jgi:crotonobetainyl-CoA:carnitine CoA-transferase CaiB-like acyl-CoA transferase
MADLLADPHVAARDAIVTVDGVQMPGVVARLSRTPGRVRHAGRPLGADDALLAGPGDGGWPARETPREESE